jgi:hypothetical protein
MRRGAQLQVDQGRRLFEATAEFEPDPTCNAHRRLPDALLRDADSGVAFLLLTFLWRRKEK